MNLREELEAVRARHSGRLTARDVVEEARDPSHPLHARVFDKDVDEAAEAYYLDRARDLIRSVKIRHVNRDGAATTVRGYLSIERAEGRAYEPTEVVGTDPFARRLLLASMKREWLNLQRQYGELAEFWGMVTEAAISRDAA